MNGSGQNACDAQHSAGGSSRSSAGLVTVETVGQRLWRDKVARHARGVDLPSLHQEVEKRRQG